MVRRNAIRKTGRSKFLARYNKSRSNLRRKRRFPRKKAPYRSKFKPFNVTRFKGISRRLNNRPEIKQTLSNINDETLAGPGSTALFNNNALAAAGNTYWTAPGSQGVGSTQYIGVKINALFFDVVFSLNSLNAALVLAVPSQYKFRIAVCRYRDTLDPNGAMPFPMTSWLTPIDTRSWDVWYDKQFVMKSGKSVVGVPLTMQSSPRKFRFRFPCKQTTTPFLNGASNAITFNTTFGVWIFSDSNNVYQIQDRSVKFFYRDP